MARTEATSSPFTVYVDATFGSDSNNGLTSGTAFKTMNKADSFLRYDVDLRGKFGKMKLAQGNYLETLHMSGSLQGGLQYYIEGDKTNWGNVHLEGSIMADNFATVTVEGMTIYAPAGGVCLAASKAACIDFSNIDFAGISGGGVHIASYYQARVFCLGNYRISGSATQHASASSGGILGINQISSIEISNNISFTDVFVAQTHGEINVYDNTMTGSGSITGYRGRANSFGIINTAGQGNAAFSGSDVFRPTDADGRIY